MIASRADSDIVLVEDDAKDVAVALRAFRNAGLGGRLVVLRDGEEALAHLLSRALPAVVLLDLRMPRMDGWEVLRRIRADARTRDLPVVVVSSSNCEVDVRKAYRCGANSYLCKTLPRGGPGAFLVDAARYWTDLNEVPW